MAWNRSSTLLAVSSDALHAVFVFEPASGRLVMRVEGHRRPCLWCDCRGEAGAGRSGHGCGEPARGSGASSGSTQPPLEVAVRLPSSLPPPSTCPSLPPAALTPQRGLCALG